MGFWFTGQIILTLLQIHIECLTAWVLLPDKTNLSVSTPKVKRHRYLLCSVQRCLVGSPSPQLTSESGWLWLLVSSFKLCFSYLTSRGFKFIPAPGKPSLPHISLVFRWRCAQHQANMSSFHGAKVLHVQYGNGDHTWHVTMQDRRPLTQTHTTFNLVFTHLSGTVFNLEVKKM